MYLEARARELEDLHKLVFLQKKNKSNYSKKPAHTVRYKTTARRDNRELL